MTSAEHNHQELPDFDKLWDYGDPAATELKFRELLRVVEQSNDLSYRAQLLTQIARTEGLQSRLSECHSTLDTVQQMLTDDLQIAAVRYLLERGRALNSSGQQASALPFFEQAFELATSIKAQKFAIDAVHMLAIAQSDPQKQVEWNLRGIAMVEADPTQSGWLAALYNNIGESYASLGHYQNAYQYFHKLSEYQREKRGEAEMYTLKDEARMLRLLGHPEQSFAIVAPIHQKSIAAGKDDGWIEEELAEALYALGSEIDSKPHFLKAHELLSGDQWVMKNDPGKLDRLKKMASV